MSMKRFIAATMICAMTVTSLVGCGNSDSSTGADTGEVKQVFNAYNNSVVIGLNPILNTTNPDNKAHNMIAEPLVRERALPNNESEFVPGLAESWEVSEDGLTYVFNIRQGAKWSDGVDVTAHDFVYTLTLMATPAVAASNGWLYDGVIENFGEALYEKGKTPEDIAVKALDDMTLEIKIIHPASYFIELISALYPVRQDKYEEWSEKYGSATEFTLSTGPFVVESWSQNTDMVLKRNENYWNAENVGLDQINYKVIQDPATAVQAFLNGELDAVATSDANWIKKLEDEGKFNVQNVPNGAPEWLMFNLGNEFLQNTKIRQAISISIDREAFVRDIFDGRAIPIYSMMPDTMNVGEDSYKSIVNGENYLVKTIAKENPDPKALLLEGMAELGLGDDPSKVTVRYASRGTTELSKKIAEYYKQALELGLGINVVIDMMEWNIMWDKIDEGDYDIASGGWGPYYNEPSALLSLYDPVNGYFNSAKSGWENEDSNRFKEILEETKIIVDIEEKAAMYLEAEDMLVGNAVIAPIYLSQRPTFTKSNLEGYYDTTTAMYDWSQPYFK